MTGETRPDNRLALMDQAFYAGHRASGQKEVMQVAWLYDRPIDLDGLKRFHQMMSRSLWGRLIERSPLPFGRYRWVAAQRSAPIDIAETPRPRAELGDWFDERAQLPVDPEQGPAWHVGVLPLTDGSTAITMIISHYVLDGLGSVVEVAKAIMGLARDHDYPPPRSRSRLRALVEDAGQAARDMPEVARALVAAAKEARRRQNDDTRKAPKPTTVRRGGDHHVVVPGVWVLIDSEVWDARAAALGGASNTLATGLAAKLGEYLGRRHPDDGTVKMQVIVSDRTEDDTRAVAVSFARTGIDPTEVTKDLSTARGAIKEALKTLRDTPDEASPLLPLTPFTPRRTWKQLMEWAMDDPDQPAVISNFGDVGSAVTCPDGTQCQAAWARGTNQHITEDRLERTGGLLQVLFGRLPTVGKISMSIQAYQPGGVTTKAALRDLVVSTLAEFDLAGEID
ncbi:condensation domain-containing protein [Mycolicibacterium pulveris]|uniref:hypothetical protein n=1 Tax=Mycolicibacterium pulveris TaxID=36813 RepID=UPI001F205C11|nr:hypothetical protein [Mycolicibacterium pulveris]